MAGDDSDVRGQIQAVEIENLRLQAENRRLWNAVDELMRDQTTIEKRLQRLEKGLKPAAKDSTG